MHLLTIDNPLQQQTIRTLLPLINERNEIIQNMLINHDANQRKIALQKIASTPWYNFIESITQKINNLVYRENRLLEERSFEASLYLQNTNQIFLIICILSEALLVLSIFLLNYYLTQRNIFMHEKIQSEQRLKLIIDGAKDYAILMLDPMGKIATWNVGARRQYGYTSEEIIGQHYSCFFSPTSIKAQYPDQELQEAKKQGRYEDQGWRFRKDGSRFWANIILVPIQDENNQLIGFSKVTRDMTEQRKLEIIKNEFVSVVSHELRTHLTSIRGALSLLLAKEKDRSLEKDRHLLNIASTNCDRLILLINDILDIEKIEVGKMAFNLQPYNLDQLMSEAISVNQIFGEKYGIRILGPTSPSNIQVLVDSDRLMQVFNNLISNAVKFSTKGKDIKLSIEAQNEKVRVSITNYGAGISDKFKLKIFEKFAQEDSSTTRAKTGTGLGLAISKAIIEKLGGHISFNSIPNDSTTFYIDLPLYSAGDRSG